MSVFLLLDSWAQIMSLDPSYSGIYHCIAANSEGKVYAIAAVGVYKNDL
jgi:sugar phosphate permease